MASVSSIERGGAHPLAGSALVARLLGASEISYSLSDIILSCPLFERAVCIFRLWTAAGAGGILSEHD